MRNRAWFVYPIVAAVATFAYLTFAHVSYLFNLISFSSPVIPKAREAKWSAYAKRVDSWQGGRRSTSLVSVAYLLETVGGSGPPRNADARNGCMGNSPLPRGVGRPSPRGGTCP